MTNMTLAGSNITLNLNELDATGRGMGVRRGVTGFGMPPVAARWIEGALDGATFRGRRVLPRDIDLPLTIVGSNHADLRRWLDTLATVLSDPIVRLTVTEEDGSVWWIDASWVGGGDYALGIDTFNRGADDTEVDTIITLRAGDPFWTNDTASSLVIGDMAVFGGRRDPFLDGLVHLPLVSSQVTGEIDLENLGNAESFPLWEITGPGSNFEARLGDQVFRWEGELAAGETLTIDARTALVQDGEGENRYGELDTAPRFWTIPPGTSRAEVGMEDTSTGTLEPGELLMENIVQNPRAIDVVLGVTTPGRWGIAWGTNGDGSFESITEDSPKLTNLCSDPRARAGTWAANNSAWRAGWSGGSNFGDPPQSGHYVSGITTPDPSITTAMRRILGQATTGGSSGDSLFGASTVAGGNDFNRIPVEVGQRITVGSLVHFELANGNPIESVFNHTPRIEIGLRGGGGNAWLGTVGSVAATPLGGGWFWGTTTGIITNPDVEAIEGRMGSGGGNTIPADRWHLTGGHIQVTHTRGIILRGHPNEIPTSIPFDEWFDGDSPSARGRSFHWHGDINNSVSHATGGDGPLTSSGEQIDTYLRATVHTPNTGGTFQVIEGLVTDTRLNVAPNNPIACSIYARIRGATANVPFLVQARPAGAGNTNISTSTHVSADGNWHRVSFILRNPNELENVRVGLHAAAGVLPAGAVVDVTAAQIVPNMSEVPAYFDGATPNRFGGMAQWAGEAHRSASLLFNTVLTGVSRIAVSWRARKWVNI